MALTTIGALAASIALVVPTPVSDPGSPEVCAWREATVRTYQELASLTYQDPASEKAKWDRELRKLLADSGAGKPDFLPEPCRAARALRQSVGSAAAVGADGADRVSPRPDSADATRPRPSAEGTVAGASTSAAERLGWGKPNRVDDFDSEASLEAWGLYDGEGHAGNGVRTPDAISVADGVLTITGDSEGNTGGMAWNPGQKYGRWEGRVSAPVSDETYNALLLLWPDAEDFPVGGEIDFMEMMDNTRQTVNLFLHYGKDNSQVDGEVKVDATEWHNWAVEWTPDGVTAYLDGEEWWNTTDTSILPPGPMHLCIQLDWFPDKSGDVKESQMHVDWVRQYAIDASEAGTKGLDADSGDSSTTDKSTDGDDADGDSTDGDSSDSDSSDSGGRQSKSRDAGSSDSSDSGDDDSSDDDSSNSSDESDSSDS